MMREVEGMVGYEVPEEQEVPEVQDRYEVCKKGEGGEGWERDVAR
jgi:hypothetical protein